MRKKGRWIPCKFCEKEIYITKSRENKKRFCSRSCSAKHQMSKLERKNRNCIVCNKEFLSFTRLAVTKKTCSYECFVQNKKNIGERRSKQKTEKLCIICGCNFIGLKHYKGTGKCNDCINKEYSEARKGKKNPAFRHGGYSKENGNLRKGQQGKHQYACSLFRKHFLNKNEYLFCEVCGCNQNKAKRFEVHHIYYASRFPKHKELHNFKNLIMLCISCHNKFHAGKNKEEFKKLEKERGLVELFK